MLKVPVCCRQIDSTMELDISSKSSLEGESVTKSSPKMSDVKCYDGSTDRPVYNYRQNHVSHVMLGGVHIVSLHIDGKERLCLAQISNTLLKQFSYNEIHNRRVALGITCVQCTPVQLEILRRAGAMPISSRRCGMITKREAERLVKSFLEDNKPPKLPENFYFEVEHQCGWGCRGKFEPARYNSSRAKCIKCSFCNLYFSPNKFIFHFHRTPESKYNHPDAANFNSWRRHLHLVSGTDSEDTTHAWEDVKAMFNGGSRKRMVSSPQFQESRHQTPEPPEVKKQKLQVEDNILTKPNFRNPYHSYPIFTMPGNTYPFSPLGAPNPLAISYHLGKADIREERKPQNLPVPWRPTSDFIIPTYDFLWTNQFGARASALQGFRPNYFSHTTSPVKDLSMSEIDRKTPSDNMNSSEDEENLSPLNVPLDTLKHGNQRLSAFKPVLKYGEKSKCSSSGSALDFVCPEKSQDGDNDDVDVGIDDDFVGDVGDEQTPASESTQPNTSCGDDINSDTVKHNEGEIHNEDKDETRVNDTRDVSHEENNKLPTDTGSLNDEADINSNKEPCVNLENINQMTKEDLQRLLQREMDLRRQVEDDINKIKEKLNDQVSRHPHQTSDIPLPCVTGKAVVSTSPCITGPTGSSADTDVMCSEFEQERKIRLSMQQKLKEAQNVLHNFSCKTLPTRPFEECPFTHPSTNLQR